MLILKHRPEGQAFNLMHTFRTLPEHSLGAKTNRCHLCTLTLPCSRAPLPPRREHLHSSSDPIFVATTQGIPLDHLVMEVRELAFMVSQGL